MGQISVGGGVHRVVYEGLEKNEKKMRNPFLVLQERARRKKCRHEGSPSLFNLPKMSSAQPYGCAVDGVILASSLQTSCIAAMKPFAIIPRIATLILPHSVEHNEKMVSKETRGCQT